MKSTTTSKGSSQKCVKEPKTRIDQKQVNNEQEAHLDSAMVSLFNAMIESCGKSFEIGSKMPISRAREIVSTWGPQMYDSELSPREFRYAYGLSNFFKRYLSVEEFNDSWKLEAESATKFLETNHEGWKYDEYVLRHGELKPLIDRMTYIVTDVLGDFDLLDIYQNAKHGPNSTTTIALSDAYLDVKNGDISGTRASLQQLKHYLSWDNQLRDCVTNYGDDIRAFVNGTESIPDRFVENFTQARFVPKSYKSLRSMCPETTVPAFFGQGVGGSIGARLTKIGIDLKTQPSVHVMLSLLASKFEELGIATLDWSEASNRIWIVLCKVLMSEGDGPRWFDFIMNVCRSNATWVTFKVKLAKGERFEAMADLEEYLEVYADGQYSVKKTGQLYVVKCLVQTSMIGTMGNAITFPLQTLIFYAFLTACTEMYADSHAVDDGINRILPDMQPVSEFGDDGIVDIRIVDTVKYYAPLLGLRLNSDKSYYSGKFRESCGGDYYCGMEVRPVMLQRPPTSPKDDPGTNARVIHAWLYIAANAASTWVVNQGGSVRPIDEWLLNQHRIFKVGKVCVVPPCMPEGSGYRIDDKVGGRVNRGETTIEFGVPYGLDPERYHIPWFSALEHGYIFTRLTTVPRPRVPHNEDSYYVRSLKHGTQGGDDVHIIHVSFFDLSKKTLSTLDEDGCVPIKECRIRKTKDCTLSWV